MSRLLTLLLLYQNNYIVGKYISIEKIIEKSKESYYESLKASSEGWHENENNYTYFVEYYLGVILNSYKDFSERVELIYTNKGTTKNRVYEIIKNNLGKITKSEIAEACPDISIGHIERTINELMLEEKIIKIGNGRYTSYILK